MRTCGGRHVLLTTPLWVPSLVRLSLCFSRFCGVVWHVRYLYLCWRTGALGGGVRLPACLYLALLAAACMRIYGRHTFCSLCKRVCGGGRVLSATPLGYLCWRGYRCAFLVCVAWRSAACNILALGGPCCCCCLCMFVFFVFVCVVLFFGCVWLPSCVLLILLSPFMPLHTILLFRGDGGLVVLVATCMYGHTFRSLCVWHAAVGMVSQSHLPVFLVSAIIVILFLAA